MHDDYDYSGLDVTHTVDGETEDLLASWRTTSLS